MNILDHLKRNEQVEECFKKPNKEKSVVKKRFQSGFENKKEKQNEEQVK